MTSDGATDTDGAHSQSGATSARLPEAHGSPGLNLFTLSAIDDPTPPVSHLHWAHVPEWIKHVLSDKWDVAFGQVSAGNATAHAFWHLQCNEEDRIQLRVSVHVETHPGEAGSVDITHSAWAARHRLTSILMSTTRSPEDLWVRGTLHDFGYSIQYANHIPAGRIVIVSGNVLVDISGASSTAALESYVRKLFEYTVIRNQPPLPIPTVRGPSLKTTRSTEGRRTDTGETLIYGIDTEFSLRFELDSSVVAANAHAGVGILVDNHVIEEIPGQGSAVTFTFVTQEFGNFTVNVHFAESLTMTSATKMVEIVVVDNEHNNDD